jgi:protease-4
VAYEDEIDDKVQLSKGTANFSDESDTATSPTSVGLNGAAHRGDLRHRRDRVGREQLRLAVGQVVGRDTMVDYLRRRAPTSIKAIVLRVDSPGGSAIASDVIWREVMLTRHVKPVIASMSDVAASGGYYIAMPRNVIVAEPATLTGSIGVVMLKFVIDGTLKSSGMNIEG